MNTARRIIRVLAICCVCNMASHAGRAKEAGGPDNSKEIGVTIELTKLEVSDSFLGLSYKISNGSDREAWVCNDVGHIPFEVFLTYDKQTLLIRKRLDVPSRTRWRGPSPVGTYVRIAPGASLTESVQIALPVSPNTEYAFEYTTEFAQPVRHLALEIGYYDEDLPALIHSIIGVAEKSGLTSRDVPANILNTYFRGLVVRGGLAGFDLVNKDPYDRGLVYVNYSYQALTGEKILRVDVNDVAVPYAGGTEHLVQ